MRGAKLRNLVIGIITVLIGAAVLLYSFKAFQPAQFNTDEPTLVLCGSCALAALGAVLLILFFFKQERLWLLVLSLALFFLGAALFVYYNYSGNQELIALTLFLLAAVSFFAAFIRDREHEWGLLVGWICLGLAGSVWASIGLVGLPQQLMIDAARAVPFILLGSIALGLLSAWLVNARQYWWALLTAGLVASVAAEMAIRETPLPNEYGPVVMFFIAGLVFFVAWLLRNDENKLQWAIYPTAVLFPLSAFLLSVRLAPDFTLLNLSVILMFIGALFITAFFFARRKPKEAKTEPDYFPATPKVETPYDQWAKKPFPESRTGVEGKLGGISLDEEPSPLTTSKKEREELLKKDKEKTREAEPEIAIPTEEEHEPEKPTVDLKDIFGEEGKEEKKGEQETDEDKLNITFEEPGEEEKKEE
jgi:hypothetical protein